MSGKTVATLSANVFVIILRLLANTEIGRQVFHKSVVLASFRNKCNIFRFVWLCNNSCSICFFIPWPIDHMGLLTLTLSNTKSYLSAAIPSNSFDLTNWKDIQSYFKKKKIIIVIEWYNPKSFKKVDPFWFNGWEHLVHWCIGYEMRLMFWRRWVESRHPIMDWHFITSIWETDLIKEKGL